MNVRGLVLIGFSAACLAVAGLAYQDQQKQGMSLALAKMMAKRDCGGEVFHTAHGRVACLRQVSFPLVKGVFGKTGAMNPGH